MHVLLFSLEGSTCMFVVCSTSQLASCIGLFRAYVVSQLTLWVIKQSSMHLTGWWEGKHGPDLHREPHGHNTVCRNPLAKINTVCHSGATNPIEWDMDSTSTHWGCTTTKAATKFGSLFPWDQFSWQQGWRGPCGCQVWPALWVPGLAGGREPANSLPCVPRKSDSSVSYTPRRNLKYRMFWFADIMKLGTISILSSYIGCRLKTETLTWPNLTT